MSGPDHRAYLLRRCTNGPRSLRELTSGQGPLLAKHIPAWLADHVVDGFLELIPGDGYVITEAGRAQMQQNAAPTSIAGSRTHCGASMPSGSLSLPKWGRDTPHIPNRDSFTNTARQA
jgi:hypothetical protein